VQLSLCEAAPVWIALLALTVRTWIVTLDQVRAMGNGAGTMGMPFRAFVAMWTAKKAAMMFPSVAPVAILWIRFIGVDSRRRGGSEDRSFCLWLSPGVDVRRYVRFLRPRAA
jgi:hypothetical protein